MRVRVRYFAVVRERLGLTDETLVLPDGSAVAIALDVLGRRHQALAELLSRVRTAVNQQMVPPTWPLHEGDELALIPPVAGGAGGRRLAAMVDRPPSLDAVVNAVRGPDVGGIVTFVGVVRAESRGRPVERLEYEAYDDMAGRVLAELCDEIEAELPGVRVAVEHRTGELAVGEAAVALAAAAPHRDEAFRACRALIDRLKERAPIWKKEHGPGGAVWVGVED